MTTLTIEISETLDEQVAVAAERSKLSKEKLAAKALENFINRQAKNGASEKTVGDARRTSFRRDWCGRFDQ